VPLPTRSGSANGASAPALQKDRATPALHDRTIRYADHQPGKTGRTAMADGSYRKCPLNWPHDVPDSPFPPPHRRLGAPDGAAQPGHPDAEARTKYVIEQLNAKGIPTEQLFIDTGMWDAAMAKDKVDAWLSSSKANEIEMIISNNDGMALGALEATKAHGKKLPIFGVDALPEVLQLIKKGEIAGTVLNDGVNQGKAVVQLSANLANGKAATEGTKWKLENRVVRIPYVGVDKDNLSEFLK